VAAQEGSGELKSHDNTINRKGHMRRWKGVFII